MPRIQPYNLPQVQEQAAPGVRLDPNAPAGAFGAGLGQGLQQAAGVLDQVQQQADTLRVEDAATQLRQQQQDLQGKALTLRGQQAFDPNAFGGQPGQGMEQAFLGQFDAAAKEIGGGLTTERQRRMFQQAAARFRLEFGGQLQDHLARETGVVAQDTYNGALAVEDQNVAQNGISPDGRIQAGTIGQSLARKVHAAEQLSSFLGEGMDMRQARVLEAQSGTHAIVLDSLLKANQPQAAQTYFDLNRSQLDPKVIAGLEAKIRDNALANTVQAQADQIASRGLSLDQQDTEAQKAMASNPEGLKLLRAELEHRFEIHQHSVRAATQEAEGQIWGAVFPVNGQGGMSIASSIKAQPDAWAALGGEGAAALKAKLEAYGKRNENDPALQVARFATFMHLLDDPRTLSGLTDGQIVSQMGALGPELTMRLLRSKREAMGNLEKLSKSTLNDIPFRDIAGEYGLKVKGNMSSDDLALLGKLRDKAMSAVRDEQQATGKELLPERKEEILRGMLTSVTTQKSGDWFSHSRPLFQVDSFMDLQATDAEKTLALDYLTRNGAPINAVNVQNMIEAIRTKGGQQ